MLRIKDTSGCDDRSPVINPTKPSRDLNGDVPIRLSRIGSRLAINRSRPGARGGLVFIPSVLKCIRDHHPDINDALQSISDIGREIHEVFDQIEALGLADHHGPSHTDWSTYQPGACSCVDDVVEWMRSRLVPRAAARSIELTFSIDPWLGVLPTSVLYNLVLEHLVRRIEALEPPKHLDVGMSEGARCIMLEIHEESVAGSALPRIDPVFLDLWIRVVHLLMGSFTWSSLVPAENSGASHRIRMTYPIDGDTQYGFTKPGHKAGARTPAAGHSEAIP